MTEKESIERCKQIVKDNNEIIKEARKNGDINTMNLTASLDNDSIAIETVIQALEQKDKIINKVYKEANNILWLDDSSDYCCALWDILRIINPDLEEYPELSYIDESEVEQ